MGEFSVLFFQTEQDPVTQFFSQVIMLKNVKIFNVYFL